MVQGKGHGACTGWVWCEGVDKAHAQRHKAETQAEAQADARAQARRGEAEAQAEAQGEAEAMEFEGSRVWQEDVDEGLRGEHVVVGWGTRAGGGAEQVLKLGAELGMETGVVMTVGSGGRGTRVQDAGWGIAPP